MALGFILRQTDNSNVGEYVLCGAALETVGASAKGRVPCTVQRTADELVLSVPMSLSVGNSIRLATWRSMPEGAPWDNIPRSELKEAWVAQTTETEFRFFDFLLNKSGSRLQLETKTLKQWDALYQKALAKPAVGEVSPFVWLPPSPAGLTADYPDMLPTRTQPIPAKPNPNPIEPRVAILPSEEEDWKRFVAASEIVVNLFTLLDNGLRITVPKAIYLRFQAWVKQNPLVKGFVPIHKRKLGTADD